MTIYAYEAQETWLPTVVGLPCRLIEIDGDTLRIHFGSIRIAADNVVEAERTIALHGIWRAERENGILAGSGDGSEETIRSALAPLKGQTLERFDVSKPGFDLDLYFSGLLTLRSFPCDSSEFDEDPDDDNVVISWWVDGDGVSDDWEEPYDPAGI